MRACGRALLYGAFVHGQTGFIVPDISFVKFARKLVK